MKIFKRYGLGALAIAVAFPLQAQSLQSFQAPNFSNQAIEPALPSLAQQLAALADSDNGRVGVAATDLATGETIAYGAHDPFPMASTVKVAIAATWLAGVDSGRFSLDQLYRHGRTAMSARRVIEAMLIRSDNVSADILLQAVGGPAAVNAWLARAGVRGQRMDRTIARLVFDDRGRTSRMVAANMPRTPLEVAQSASFNDDGQVNPAFVGDARDTSTPTAMVKLLAKLHGGNLLEPETTRYLFDVMARCVTGSRRIKGMLPSGTPVAHKTGTLAGVSDDVGIVTLPNGHPLAIALFAKGMRSDQERDRSIALLARLLYDRFSAMERGAMGKLVAR